MVTKDKEDFSPELNLFLTSAAWLRNPPTLSLSSLRSHTAEITANMLPKQIVVVSFLIKL